MVLSITLMRERLHWELSGVLCRLEETDRNELSGSLFSLGLKIKYQNCSLATIDIDTSCLTPKVLRKLLYVLLLPDMLAHSPLGHLSRYILMRERIRNGVLYSLGRSCGGAYLFLRVIP